MRVSHTPHGIPFRVPEADDAGPEHLAADEPTCACCEQDTAEFQCRGCGRLICHDCQRFCSACRVMRCVTCAVPVEHSDGDQEDFCEAHVPAKQPKKPLPRMETWPPGDALGPGYIVTWPMFEPTTQKFWWHFPHAAQAVEQVLAWFRYYAQEDRAA
jgi:hypothetical protein